MMDELAFAWWLVGLVDGEGHFGITRGFKASGAGPYYRCVFRVSLVAADADVLTMAQRRTGWGAIYFYDHRGARRAGRACAVVTWTANTKAAVGQIADFFERYPLQSKKAAEFEVWARAARAHARRRYLGRAHVNAPEQRDLEQAYEALLAMRGHEPQRRRAA